MIGIGEMMEGGMAIDQRDLKSSGFNSLSYPTDLFCVFPYHPIPIPPRTYSLALLYPNRPGV